MTEQTKGQEQQSTPLDISKKVRAIIEAPEKKTPKAFQLMDLMREPDISQAKALKLDLPWYSENYAKWVKSWIERGAFEGQERHASITCTESQRKSAANVFASGVEWINSELKS